MTKEEREELIEHWMWIIQCVFAAEDNISEKWFPELRRAKMLPPGEKKEMAEAYLRALAEEILLEAKENADS